MKDSEAIDLIRQAVPRSAGTWADLGAGEGTFTRALAQRLEPGARILAVDRDARALARLKRSWTGPTEVITVEADFTRPLELPGVHAGSLDGILLANALHFVADPGATLARLGAWLRPGGRLVVVEYERRRPNPWVPHPIEPSRLVQVARGAGFTEPIITARQPSAFGGNLYAAAADRLEGKLRSAAAASP